MSQALDPQGFSDRQLALRTVALIVAVSVNGDPTRRGTLVVRVHELARKVIAAGYRITFDGDRYYLTRPRPVGQLELADADTTVDGLSVLGAAERLADLFDLVDRVVDGG